MDLQALCVLMIGTVSQQPGPENNIGCKIGLSGMKMTCFGIAGEERP